MEFRNRSRNRSYSQMITIETYSWWMVTRADSCDESDSPCEPFCAPKLLDFDYVPYDAHKPDDNGWHTPHDIDWTTFHAAVFLAALFEYKYGAGLLVVVSSNKQMSQQQ